MQSLTCAKVLPKLINEDQTGYVKGRYIDQNIRLINDIMKITELEKTPSMAIFIDFKKAFDTVDWNFLFKTLEALNFGPQLQQWIRTFYVDSSRSVTNNGYASAFFNQYKEVFAKGAHSLAPCLCSAPKFLLTQ